MADIEARRAALGMKDTPAEVGTMRNKGGRRTPEKRELLRRVEGRSRAAGMEPLKSYD
ncbi:MAG TPA: hypothetical protein VGC15_06405 [Acetobacteraceae bacterium]